MSPSYRDIPTCGDMATTVCGDMPPPCMETLSPSYIRTLPLSCIGMFPCVWPLVTPMYGDTAILKPMMSIFKCIMKYSPGSQCLICSKENIFLACSRATEQQQLALLQYQKLNCNICPSAIFSGLMLLLRTLQQCRQVILMMSSM